MQAELAACEALIAADRIGEAQERLLRCEQRLDPRAAPAVWGEFLRLRGELPALTGSGPASWLKGALDLAKVVERVPIKGDRTEPLRRELESFREAALGHAPPAVSGEEGRAALAVILDIQERIQRTVETSWASAPAAPARAAEL